MKVKDNDDCRVSVAAVFNVVVSNGDLVDDDDDDHDDDNDDTTTTTTAAAAAATATTTTTTTNRIQRRSSRFFNISSLRCKPSPTRTLKRPESNRVQILSYGNLDDGNDNDDCHVDVAGVFNAVVSNGDLENVDDNGDDNSDNDEDIGNTNSIPSQYELIMTENHRVI